MPEAPRPDWRNTDANASETTGARAWQKHESDAKFAKLPSRRFVRRAIVLTCLIGLAVGIGWLISLPKGTRPACLVLVGSGYEHNLLLPHNVYGWNSGLRLRKKFDDKNNDPNWVGRLFGQRAGIRSTNPVLLVRETWPETWQKIASRIDEGKANEKEQVILYISAHGYADENDAYLLRDIDDIKSPEDFNKSRVTFRELLDSIKQVREPKGVLLILDVCHVQSHWPIGMLKNDFVERLQQKHTEEIKKIGNLTVICSTSPGQRSWASEERQTSVFAEYLSEGLQGKGGAVDERVTASRLFEYVQEKTNEWAKANRAREQIPKLIAAGREIELVHVAKVKDQQPGKVEAPDDKQEKGKAPNANPIDGLKSDWQRWKDLKIKYAPQVYCPHYWRLYQETLLRYEQLRRAGDPTNKADALKKKLDGLADDIKKAKPLDDASDCLGNSFPMARVLGIRPDKELPENLLKQYWEQLDARDDGPREKTASQLFAGKSEVDRRYWQTRLSQLLLEAQLDKKDRTSIRLDLMKVTKDLDQPQRAVEVHMVKVLKDVDPALDNIAPNLFKLAVVVRRMAEEAALGIPGENNLSELYAEVIFKRMQTDVKVADENRRDGENWLFGDPKTQADTAREKLTLALKGYEKIRADAKKLRNALALRDDIAAELPFFAASLALLPSVNHGTAKDIETMRKEAGSLGKSLALLTKCLEKPEDSLPDLQPIEKNLTSIREHYRELCKKLEILEAPKLQLNWHAIDGVLSIPPAKAADEEVELRIKLLIKLSKTSRELAAVNVVHPQPEKQEETVKVQHELLRECLKSYEEQDQAAEPKTVEDNVRKFFLGQLKKTFEETADVQNKPDLQSAVGHCRVLLGAMADQLKDKQGDRINPAKRLRNLRTSQLLQWLAERTLDDHWFDPGAKGEPTYYAPVASAYLKSADKLLEPKLGGPLDRQRLFLKGRLQREGLDIPEAPKEYWTTQEVFVLKCTVGAKNGVPAGRPTVWFEGPKGEKLTERKTDTALPNPFSASVSLNKANFAGAEIVPVTLHALYRGQHVIKDLTVESHPPNVIVRHTPGPDDVAFAVRMDKFDYGAISIVLDNSGSMRYRYPLIEDMKGKPATGKLGERRFDFAIKALEQVLRDKLPLDTNLSVSDFTGEKVTVPRFVKWPNHPSGKPYKPWRPSPDRIKDLTDDLKESFERSVKWGNNDSPIAKAIIESMERGFPKDGNDKPRLIVVLTDGMDSKSFKGIPGVDYDDQVAQELRNAMKNHRGVEIVLVCFIDKKVDKEYKHAVTQFEPLGEGNVIFESDGVKLGGIIENRIVRPRVQLKFGVNAAPGFEYGQSVNYGSDSDLAWHRLASNDYKAGLVTSKGIEFDNKMGPFDVKMAPGYNIFAILKRDGKKLILERGILASQNEVKANGAVTHLKADWLVTLLENGRGDGGETRSQLVAFEKATPEADSIRQTHPGFVWLELETRDGRKPEKTLEWGSDLVVPAAAFAVKMTGWPGGDPKLAAWFWPESWKNLLDNVKPIMETSIDTTVQNNLIESVAWETRVVSFMTPHGKDEKKKSCLVVRARYHNGKPVYVGLKGIDDSLRVGSEHQFFHSAGRCTACFYFDGPRPSQGASLVLIDVEQFKGAATKGGTMVEFTPTESIAVPNIFREAIRTKTDDRR